MAAPLKGVGGAVRLFTNIRIAACRCRHSCTTKTVLIPTRQYGNRAPVVQTVKSKYWPVVLASGLAVGYVIGRGWYATNALPQVEAAMPFGGGDSLPPLSNRGRLNFIADVVEKVAPTVVYIEIQGRWVHCSQA